MDSKFFRFFLAVIFCLLTQFEGQANDQIQDEQLLKEKSRKNGADKKGNSDKASKKNNPQKKQGPSKKEIEEAMKQAQRPGPVGEDQIINTNIDSPEDKAVRQAIIKAMNFLLSKQKEDGSWDEDLSNLGPLGRTADEAVDAVSFTSLCALGLREHAKLLPDVDIKGIVKKSTRYVMDRVIRGTLSNSVMYAIWRYSLGLQLLSAEYVDVSKSKEPEDVAYREELGFVAGRMIKNIAEMQFMSDKKYWRSTRKDRIYGQYSGPTHLGLVCAYPTETDYRGGALVTEVLPGSSAAEKGFKVGDRITRLNGVGIENSYDYYDIASNFVGGQQISLSYFLAQEGGNGYTVERRNKKYKTASLTIKNTWPSYLGIKIKNDKSGISVQRIVSSKLKQSTKPKFIVGDIITEIDKQPITNMDDYFAAMKKTEMGKKISVKVRREGKEKTVSGITAVPVPVGHLRIAPVYEDKSGKNGVKIENVGEELGENIQRGDRIIRFNDNSVLGLDHFITLLTTCPQDIAIPVTVIRDEKEIKTHVIARENANIKTGTSQAHNYGAIKAAGSSLDVVWKVQPNENFFAMPVFVETVIKKGVSERLLIKGDKIDSIDYNGTIHKIESKRKLLAILKNIPAGSEIIVNISRKNKPKDIVIKRTSKASASGDANVQGGWSYYKMGEAFTFITATVLLSLQDAKDNMGRDLPNLYSNSILSNIMEPAFDFLQKMNLNDSYAYRPGSARGMDSKARGSMGRITACELAMMRGKQSKHNKATLAKSLDLWMQQREELDKVRLYRMTHYRPLFQNAAYYWLFSHYHTARAANVVGGRTKKDIHELILKLMMSTRRENGTWLGHYAFGEICGTARALMILGEIEGDFREFPEGDKETNSKYNTTTK